MQRTVEAAEPFRRWWCTTIAALVLGVMCLDAAADTIIRNVRLIDRNVQAEPVAVFIRVEGEYVRLVSRQPIRAKPGDIEVDGGGGFVIGRLEVGGPANLMILDRDPREDFNTLLDTKSHATFAMHRGDIVKSTLSASPKLATGADDEGGESTGWFAYSPPPMSLPIHYGNSRPWNHFDTEWLAGAFVLAAMLDRTRWWSDDETEASLGEAVDGTGRGSIRGLRFGIVGAIKFPKPWTYTFFAASNAFTSGFDDMDDDAYSLFDYRLDVPLYRSLTLSAGKQKEPISQERITFGLGLVMQERTMAAEAFLPSRNVGVVVSDHSRYLRASIAVGGFNDWFDSGESFGDSSRQIVARGTWAPWVSADEGTLLHLGLGYRYSDTPPGVQYRTKPEVYDGPVFLDTGPIDAASSQTWVGEAAVRYGPALLGFDFSWVDVNAEDQADPQFYGGSATASWILTGEMREYSWTNGTFGPVRVASPVTSGGGGAVEVGLRGSFLNLNDGAIEGGRSGILSAAVNWWPHASFMTSLNYRWINVERTGESGTSHALVARLTFFLQ